MKPVAKHFPKLSAGRLWLGSHLLMVAFLLGINLTMSFLVRQVGSFAVNKEVFHVPVDLWLITLLAVVVTGLCFYVGLAWDYPVPCVLIIAGAWSNLTERFIFGGVADYIDIYIALTNLADLQIWLGLVAVNWQVWFPQNHLRVAQYLPTWKR